MEFALIVPILIMLVFGVLSYGLMLSFRQSISQSAAEGARAAAVAPATADRQAIAFEAIGAAMDATCNAGYLVCTAATPAACGCMEVTVTYDYAADPSKPKLMFGFALPDRLSYTAVAEIS